MKYIIYINIFLIIFYSSCIKPSEFKLIKDVNFFNPKLRYYGILNGKLYYTFNEYFIVYGYDDNIEKIDSVSKKIISERLNSDINYIRIIIGYEILNKYNKYHEGVSYKTYYTDNSYEAIWQHEEPDKFQLSYEGNLISKNPIVYDSLIRYR